MHKKTNHTQKAEHLWRCAFQWQHFALTGVAVVFIVTGFLLMLPPVDIRNTPGGRFAASPGPGAFEARRIRLAPIPCFIGFAMMVPTIMYVPKGAKSERMKREKSKNEDEKL